jgi:5S rRNA maturation endonuclease (ribonuclease M5)
MSKYKQSLLLIFILNKHMISTKNINTLPLNTNNILKFINDEDIFRKYINHDFKIGEVFSAEYRDDKKPSFGIYWNDHTNKLMYKDLSKKYGGDCFSYVQLIYKCDFWKALEIINSDFKLGLGGKKLELSPTINYEKKEYVKHRKKISIVKQDYTEIDKEYWGEHGITIETLKKYNVFSCQSYSVDNELRRVYVRDYPIYAYYFPRTGNYKIYIPTEKSGLKWATNANNDWDIQGYDQLDNWNGGYIFITKSLKDVMCLYELGFTSVATHAEGHYFNPDFIRHLKERFKNVIIFYDNDESGKICAKKMAEEYKLNTFFLPDYYYNKDQIKDISGLVKFYGKKTGREMVMQAFKV